MKKTPPDAAGGECPGGGTALGGAQLSSRLHALCRFSIQDAGMALNWLLSILTGIRKSERSALKEQLNLLERQLAESREKLAEAEQEKAKTAGELENAKRQNEQCKQDYAKALDQLECLLSVVSVGHWLFSKTPGIDPMNPICPRCYAAKRRTLLVVARQQPRVEHDVSNPFRPMVYYDMATFKYPVCSFKKEESERNWISVLKQLSML